MIFKRKLVLPILFLLTAFGLIWPIYYIYVHGFTLSNLLDADELGEMTKAFSTERYNSYEEKGYSKLSQLLLIFTYTAPIVGGFCWLLTKSIPSKILCILSILPGLLITWSQSTKMTTITALILWVGGFLTSAISYNVKLKISLKSAFVILSLLVLFFIAMFYSHLTRWGNDINETKINRNKISLFDYALGSLLCFDYWFYDNLHNVDYSTRILQNSHLNRLGYLSNTENGVKIEFANSIHAPYFEIYGQDLHYCEYFAGKAYTISFNVTSNIKPDSAKYSIFSTTTMPKGHLHILMDSCKQTGLHTWRYIHSFCLDSNRLICRTPDIILSFDSIKAVEISKLRIDTGKVAQSWRPKGNNLFWYNDRLWYGASTFFGIFNHLGITKQNLRLCNEYVKFGRLDKTMQSNVYTIFRTLIEDFGKIGAIVFLFLLGFLTGKAEALICKKKLTYICQAFLVAVYGYILFGFATSMWAFTSILGSFGLSLIVFYILQKPRI